MKTSLDIITEGLAEGIKVRAKGKIIECASTTSSTPKSFIDELKREGYVLLDESKHRHYQAWVKYDNP